MAATYTLTDNGTAIIVTYSGGAVIQFNKNQIVNLLFTPEGTTRIKTTADRNNTFIFDKANITSPVFATDADLFAWLNAASVSSLSKSQNFPDTTAAQDVFTITNDMVIGTNAANLFVVLDGVTYASTDTAVLATRTGAKEVTLGVPVAEHSNVTIIYFS